MSSVQGDTTAGGGTRAAPATVAAAVDTTGLEGFLGIMMQDANGDDVYSNERSLVGYLEASKYLLVPSAVITEAQSHAEIPVDVKAFGKRNGVSDYLAAKGKAYAAVNPLFQLFPDPMDEDVRRLNMTKMTVMNYRALVTAGLTSAEAFVGAVLRTRWAFCGALTIAGADQTSAYKEIIEIDDADATYGGVNRARTVAKVVEDDAATGAAFMAFFSGDQELYKWAVNKAENIWVAVEHCFRLRAHHYKSGGDDEASYKELYIRVLTAAYEGEFAWPKDVSMFTVFHTAIHPFKMKALVKMTAHFMAHGLVANALITRSSGSPCGTAAITTTIAALDTMKSEIWWSAFGRVYKEQLDKLKEYSNAIQEDKYSFHQAAGLYGVTKQNSFTINGTTVTVDDAKQEVSSIAAAAQGMIEALRTAVKEELISKFALNNARALEKPASSNPMLAIKVKTLVLMSIEQINDSTKISDAISAALGSEKTVPAIANQPA
jgi:hypothetical protein